MILGIVGAEEKSWLIPAKIKAKEYILNFILEVNPEIITSGHCPYGGVDLWAEAYAYLLNIPTKIFPAEVNQWIDKDGLKGYKSRNEEIARASDILLVISPMIDSKVIKNGGEWTGDYASTLVGKTITRARFTNIGTVKIETTITDDIYKYN